MTAPAGFNAAKVTEAVAALVKYAQDSAAKADKQDLLMDFVDDDDKTPLEAIDLQVSTKKYGRTEKNLKPCVVSLPHSIRSKDRGAVSICIFVKDPEAEAVKLLVDQTKTYDECLAALEAEKGSDEDAADEDSTIEYAQKRKGLASLKDLASIRIDRVVGVSSLKGEFKPFQARRKLISEHDLFFAQDSIFDQLPGLLGKSFYKSSKTTPLVISMSRRTPAQVAELKKITLNVLSKKKEEVSEALSLTKTLQQIYTCYNGTSYVLSPGTKLHMRVGSTALTPKANAENITSAVTDLIAQKKAVSSWAGIRALFVKTPSGPSLPVYLDDTPYEDAEQDVVEDEDELIARKREAEAAKANEEKKRKRSDKSHIETLLEEVVDEQDLAEFLEKKKEARTAARKEAQKAKLEAGAKKPEANDEGDDEEKEAEEEQDEEEDEEEEKEEVKPKEKKAKVEKKAAKPTKRVSKK